MFLNNHLASNMLANARITVNSNVKTETNTSVSANNNMSTKLVLGYGVDNDGYFTEDFNKAAGIPEHIKIHSSTMESLYRAEVETPTHPWFKTFSDIDIAKTIGNAYKILSQIVNEETLAKENFTKEEIANLPQGYEYNRKTLEVTKVHQGIFDYHGAASSFHYDNKNNQMINSTFFNPVDWSDRHNPKYKPATDIFNSMNGGKENKEMGLFWDTTADKYTNSDGTISMGGILIGIINSSSDIKEGTATYMGQMQGYDRNVDADTIRAEYYASWGKSVFDYSDQELNMMTEQRRDFIKGMQKEQIKIWVVNGYGIPDNARHAYNSYMNNEETEPKDPIVAAIDAINKEARERLERLRKKLIEERQKAQEEARKQAQEQDIEKLYEQSNQTIREFVENLEKLQEESNKTKDPKDQWHVSADLIQKAVMDMLNAQNQQSYAPTTKQQVGTFEVEA